MLQQMGRRRLLEAKILASFRFDTETKTENENENEKETKPSATKRNEPKRFGLRGLQNQSQKQLQSHGALEDADEPAYFSKLNHF